MKRCCVVGTGVALTVCGEQCTAEMLKILIQGEGVLFVHWQTYLVFFGLGTCIFLQVSRTPHWLSGARVFTHRVAEIWGSMS